MWAAGVMDRNIAFASNQERSSCKFFFFFFFLLHLNRFFIDRDDRDYEARVSYYGCECDA